MRENVEDLWGVTGGSTESESWVVEGYPLSEGLCAVSDDHEMGDPDDLQLGLADDPMSAAVAASRRPGLARQLQETLDCLPGSRPVLEIEMSEDRRTETVLGPSQELCGTGAFGEAASIAPQLTYQRAAQLASSPGLTGLSNGVEDPRCAFDGSASLEPLPRRQLETSDDSSIVSPGPVDLDSASTSCVGTKRKRPESTQGKAEPQREEKMIKMLDEIPTDLLARYLKEKGIRSDADTAPDSDDSGAKQETRSAQKHQCTDCGRGFSRNSELKYVLYTLLSPLSPTVRHDPWHPRGCLANTEQQAHAPPREALRLHLPRVQQALREQERLEAPREQPALSSGDVEV